MVKDLPAVGETQVQSLGWEDLLEKEMATHSSILSWRIPWMEEPGGLQSVGSQRVRYDWATKHTRVIRQAGYLSRCLTPLLSYLSGKRRENWGKIPSSTHPENLSHSVVGQLLKCSSPTAGLGGTNLHLGALKSKALDIWATWLLNVHTSLPMNTVWASHTTLIHFYW